MGPVGLTPCKNGILHPLRLGSKLPSLAALPLKGRGLLAALAALLLAAPAAHADTLIDNVNGITLDAEGKVVRFTGLVIGDDGKVKQLLARTDKRPERVDFKQDARGATMLPGFIDAHGHVMGLGFQRMLLDLSATTSLAEAQAKIRQFAAENPEMPWILGTGWNQEKWGLGRFPTAADLDAAVADRPVWLERVDGHAGWGNSRVLALAKVTAATKDPAGGRIERGPGGAPAGVFVDAAMALVNAAKPKPLARDLDRALSLAQGALLEWGITSVTDMGTTLEEWQAYRRAGDKGALIVRILSYGGDIDNMAIIGGPGPTPWLYNDRLRMGGVKLYLDVKVSGMGAAIAAAITQANVTPADLYIWTYSEADRLGIRSFIPDARFVTGEIPTSQARMDQLIAQGVVGFDLSTGQSGFTTQFVDFARANGRFVWAYTVLDPDTMLAMIDRGVDGMETDFPAVLESLFAPLQPCPGDANGDRAITFADITEVLANIGLSYPGGTGPGDADQNGQVNFSDITSVLTFLGTSCP